MSNSGAIVPYAGRVTLGFATHF